MGKLITGIHHVTAIAGDAQKNLEFYAGILGVRMVKKTVNFDAPKYTTSTMAMKQVTPAVSLLSSPTRDW
ncbi:VOC family protein [Paraflavitalea speifideaquila]|uniref:VOC family protein n=1 Tax=Paraflavitalea speifideaquila TaxID=3076558 RepID=UPI0028EAF633|nr:VOC family protein [Paraflavitalea speifideiaquila]